MPGPQPARLVKSHGRPLFLNDRARGTHWLDVRVVFHLMLRSQPRFVFSIPYNAALLALTMPGGKCTPLMKRTVREESGAWLWLKNAAVRATPTARSSLFGSACSCRNTASGRPAR